MLVQLKRLATDGAQLKVAAMKGFETKPSHPKDVLLNTNDDQIVVVELHRPAQDKDRPQQQPIDPNSTGSCQPEVAWSESAPMDTTAQESCLVTQAETNHQQGQEEKPDEDPTVASTMADIRSLGAEAMAECEEKACPAEHTSNASGQAAPAGIQHAAADAPQPHTQSEVYDDEPTGANGLIVSFSPTLSAALRSNSDVQPLGNAVQATGALHYLLKYLTKSDDQVLSTLSLTRAAQTHISLHPSKAGDSGTEERTAQHLLTRLLNAGKNAHETSGQLNALCINGFPGNVFSTEFAHLFVSQAVAYARTTSESQGMVTRTTMDQIERIIDDEPDEEDEYDMLMQDIDREGLGQEVDHGQEHEGTLQVVARGPDNRKRVDLMPSHMTYRWRHADLSAMSLYEFTGCTVLKPKNPPKSEIDPNTHHQQHAGGARPRNATFELHPKHPMASTHHVCLRSKQVVPLLTGHKWPRHPGIPRSEPDWMKQADEYAASLITMHVPWCLHSGIPTIPLTYAALLQHCHNLKDQQSAEATCRLQWMTNLSRMSISRKNLQTATAYRTRMARVWAAGDHKGDEPCADQERNGTAVDSEDGGADDNAAAAVAKVLDAFRAGEDRSKTEMEIQRAVHTNHSAKQLKDMSDRIRQYRNEQRQPTMPSAQSPIETVPATRMELKDDPRLQTLNEQQKVSYNLIVSAINQSTPGAPLRLMLHGAPGTGKTHLIRTVVDKLGEATLSCTAPHALAAANMPGGRTLHNAAAVTIRGTLSKSKATVATAKQQIASAKCLVIDEISTLSSQLAEAVDQRLRQWRDPEISWGGMHLVILGDVMQTESIGRSLLKAKPGTRAASLFKEFDTIISLTDQMRAAEDQQWAQLLTEIRRPDIEHPVLHTKLLTIVKPLTAQDVRSEPGWATATIVTCTNTARHAINQEQARRFSKIHGLPIIKWVFKLTPRSENIVRATALERKVSAADVIDACNGAAITFLFVKGSPALLSGENMNTAMKLCNNSKGLLHSLTLNPSQVPGLQQRLQNARPGEVVTLDEPPICINVEFPQLDASTWPPDQTLVHDRVVIPVFPRKQPMEFWSNRQHKLQAIHGGVELGYAYTPEKVRTTST